MNLMQLKPLLQVQEGDNGDQKISVTLLVTAESLRSMLDMLARNPQKSAVVKLDTGSNEFALEVYEPTITGELQYTKNMTRTDWSTLSVATL